MLKSVEKNAISETLGLLLIGTNIVRREAIDEATRNAKAMGVPLESALVMSGQAREYSLRPALEADALVKEGIISVDTAIKALRLAKSNEITLAEAIRVLSSIHKKTQTTGLAQSEFHNLLMAAGMINQEQLSRVFKISQETGMQVGRILVLNRELLNWMMMAALSAQILVRDEKITKEQAISALKAVMRHRITIEQALFELGFYMENPGQTVRLGELFAMAFYLNESDMLECLEIELVKEKQFGQILLEQGLVSQTLLETAIVLQGMVANETLKAYEAAEALKQMRTRDVSVYQVVAELKSSRKMCQPLLKITELLDQAQIAESDMINNLVRYEESSIKIGKILLGSGLIDEMTLYNSLRCYSLLKEGYLSNEQATSVLRLCSKDNVTLDDALPKLGFNLPARMQWIWT